jgi:hypothetical protein
MTGTRGVALVLLGLAVAVIPACVRMSDGVAVAGDTARPTVPPAKTVPNRAGNAPALGVVPTTRVPIPPNTTTCSQPVKPPVGVVSEVADPHAPKVTVGVPKGWSMTGGSGDTGGRLGGPAGMSATVTIAKTQLDPAAAFRKYADDLLKKYADNLMAKSAVASVSVLPADLCGYSGQKLMGSWTDTRQNAVQFEDRIVHVWTNQGDYLVAVHAQAPTSAPGFDAAASVLTGGFDIALP